MRTVTADPIDATSRTTTPPVGSQAVVAVEEALRVVPRTVFLAGKGGGAMLTGSRSLPSPEAVARLLEAARLSRSDRVLLVGTGSGYSTALVAELAAKAYGIERVLPLAEQCRARLASIGCANAEIRHGNGLVGWPEQAPFDAILVSMTMDAVPVPLERQLAIGGRLVFTRRRPDGTHVLVRITRTGDDRFDRAELGEVEHAIGFAGLLAGREITSPEFVQALRRTAAQHGGDAEATMRDLLRRPDAELYAAVGANLGLVFSPAEPLLDALDPTLVEALPMAFLRFNHLLPIERRDGVVIVASPDPGAPLDDVERALPGTRAELRLVTPETLRRLFANVDLRRSGRLTDEPARAASPQAHELVAATAGLAPDARLVALFDAMMIDAIGERASDVHLERYRDRVRVRFRIDGDLHDITRYGISAQDLLGLMNVIKVGADLDIAERRLPQGGRMGIRSAGGAFDLRVQTQPSLHGEHVVIRILPQDTKLLTIEDLGFPADIAARYRRILDEPNGLVLVVGPTGSGKSTTLYAGLQVLVKDPTRKVITVEDPIEYSIEGIQQTQARPEIGFAFHDAMRSFVREDPDVILVGEIRDGETALEALRASQTGHLVLSTLHCNDAVDAIQRLVDLGQHRNSIASELVGVIAQRLVRRNCTSCRRTVEADPKLLAELFPSGVPAGFTVKAGAGCERCGGRGTRGRIAVVEFLPAGPEMRAAISAGRTADELRAIALRTGLHSLRWSLLDLVADGTIPLGEARTVLSAERMGEGG